MWITKITNLHFQKTKVHTSVRKQIGKAVIIAHIIGFYPPKGHEL